MQRDDTTTSEWLSEKNNLKISASRMIPMALRLANAEEAYSVYLRKNNSGEYTLGTYLQAFAENFVVDDGWQPHKPNWQKIEAYERSKGIPCLEQILQITHYKKCYDKLYQQLTSSLRPGFDAYNRNGWMQRWGRLGIASLADVTFYTMAGLAIRNIKELREQLSDYSGTCLVILTASQELKSIKAFRELPIFVPAIYRSGSEESFAHENHKVAVISAWKIFISDLVEKDRGNDPCGENEWREIGSKVVAAVRLDAAHFLNASSFGEGIFKYILGHVACCSYSSHPFKLMQTCMRDPSDWIGNSEYMSTVFISEFVENLFERVQTSSISVND